MDSTVFNSTKVSALPCASHSKMANILKDLSFKPNHRFYRLLVSQNASIRRILHLPQVENEIEVGHKSHLHRKIPVSFRSTERNYGRQSCRNIPGINSEWIPLLSGVLTSGLASWVGWVSLHQLGITPIQNVGTQLATFLLLMLEVRLEFQLPRLKILTKECCQWLSIQTEAFTNKFCGYQIARW